MTELATYNGHSTALAQPAPEPETQRPSNDLMAWAESAVAANNIAQSLARTSFVPKAFQGKPDEVTAAILTGQEMGLSPMAALRSMHVIQGTAGLDAIALRGLVQSHGHEIWTEESTDVRAIVCGRRRGSDKVERVVWTIERAAKAGYVAKNQNYKSVPQDMLLARATASVARLIDADGLLGMPYAREELEDEAGVSSEAPAAKRVSRKKPQPIPAPEPEVTAPTAAEAAEDGASDEQAASHDEPPLWPDTAEPGSRPAQ
ncbi:hypothetical protein ACFQ6Q_04325 [Streptomyces sp. NPDC056437]|uniref:hypothetical protein n=1 Tax=Streptomyces sp. NPDC056437 TaxID=3345816 RepID=UPI0036C63673